MRRSVSSVFTLPEQTKHEVSALAYRQASEQLIQAGRYSRAVETLRRAIHYAPGQADLHSLLGHCFVRLGQPVSAAEAFVQAASKARARGEDAWAQALEHKAAFLRRPTAASARVARGAVEDNALAPTPASVTAFEDPDGWMEGETQVLEPTELPGPRAARPTVSSHITVDDSDIDHITDDDLEALWVEVSHFDRA